MNINLSVTFTGNPDEEDALAAKTRIAVENDAIRRENLNREIHNTQNPGDQKPPLPLLSDTGGQLKTNYLALLSGDAQKKHTGLAKQGTERKLQELKPLALNATQLGLDLAEQALAANQRP